MEPESTEFKPKDRKQEVKLRVARWFNLVMDRYGLDVRRIHEALMERLRTDPGVIEKRSRGQRIDGVTVQWLYRLKSGKKPGDPYPRLETWSRLVEVIASLATNDPELASRIYREGMEAAGYLQPDSKPVEPVATEIVGRFEQMKDMLAGIVSDLTNEPREADNRPDIVLALKRLSLRAEGVPIRVPFGGPLSAIGEGRVPESDFGNERYHIHVVEGDLLEPLAKCGDRVILSYHLGSVPTEDYLSGAVGSYLIYRDLKNTMTECARLLSVGPKPGSFLNLLTLRGVQKAVRLSMVVPVAVLAYITPP